MNAEKKILGSLRGGLLVVVLAAWVMAPCPARAAEESAGLSVGKNFDVTPGLAKGSQRWPAVAAGKDYYLVVWQEGEALAGVKDTNILAARVSLDGKPLDLKGIPVCAAKGLQAYPAVAFDGVNFLVAWQDYRNGQDWDIYLARVSQDGKVLDPDGIPVAAVPGNQVQPALASDGKERHLLVWSDLRPQPAGKPEGCYGISGTFIRDGKPSEAGGRELVPPKESSYMSLKACWNGEFFAVGASACPYHFWVKSFATKVTADGKVEPLNWGFLGHTFAVAADPAAKRTFFWSAGPLGHGAMCRYYLASVNGTASYLTIGLQGMYHPANGFDNAAAFDGKNFVGIFEQTPLEVRKDGDNNSKEAFPMDLVAVRVDPATSKPLDTGGFDWSKGGDMRNAPVLDAGTAKTGVPVASEPVSERHPALASCGGGKSLLVYSRRGGAEKYKIYAVVLSE